MTKVAKARLKVVLLRADWTLMVCGNCGRRGHWKNECWLPPMQGRVQQVADDGHITGVPSSAASSVSQATASTRAPTVGSRQVNRVEAFSAVVESDEEVDLTVYSMPSGSHVRVVQYRSAVHVQSSAGPGAIMRSPGARCSPGAIKVQSRCNQVQSRSGQVRCCWSLRVRSGMTCQVPIPMVSGPCVVSRVPVTFHVMP